MPLHLTIITPRKKVIESDIQSITVPTVAGEITILPRHAHLLSLLKEGVMTIRMNHQEELMSIGGGYLETDGISITILVSRAYNQSEIDEVMTTEALAKARELLQVTKDIKERSEAAAMIKRSQVDLALLRKIRRRRQS